MCTDRYMSMRDVGSDGRSLVQVSPGTDRQAFTRVRSDHLFWAVFVVPGVSCLLLALHAQVMAPAHAVSTLHCQVVELQRQAYLTGEALTKTDFDRLFLHGSLIQRGNKAQLVMERSSAFVIPSLLSLMSAVSPQMHLMKAVATLHALPRLVITQALHRQTLDGATHRGTRCLSTVRSLLELTEIQALMGVLFVSPSQNYKVYNFFLLLLVSCCILNMACSSLLDFRIKKHHKLFVKSGTCSTRLKLLILMAALLLAWRLVVGQDGTSYCQDNVYRIAAILEYVILCCVMAFHYLATERLSPGEMVVVFPKDKYT